MSNRQLLAAIRKATDLHVDVNGSDSVLRVRVNKTDLINVIKSTDLDSEADFQILSEEGTNTQFLTAKF